MPRTSYSKFLPKGMPNNLVEKWVSLFNSLNEISPDVISVKVKDLLKDTAYSYNNEKDALILALQEAECALGDIGDADREPEDDIEWCEKRAAEALPKVRETLNKVGAKHSGIGHFLSPDDHA